MEEFQSNHRMQLAQIPIEYHESFYQKISHEILDASDFEIMHGELRAVKEINDIYLVDHSWNVGSFDQVEKDAKSVPGLAARFPFDLQKIDLDLVNIVTQATQADQEIVIQALRNSDWQTLDAIQILSESLEQREARESLEAALGHNPGSNISKTVNNFWNFCSFYNAGYNCWYITDEVGLAIHNSEEPNVKMIPFLTIKNGNLIGYSVFWPIKKIYRGDLILRDALPAGLKDLLHRQIYSNVVLGVSNDSEKESIEAFNSFEAKFNSQKSVTLKRQYSEPTETIDFYIIQKLVFSKYGCVPWIPRMYQLPLEFAEWNGHFVSDNECAWEIFGGSESIVTQNHAFLIHQLDIGSIYYLKKIEKNVSLYGGRRFTLDFLIRISRDQNLEIFLSDQFYARIAEEPDLVDGKWKNSVLKTKFWNDKPTPSSEVFLKNYPNLPYQEIKDCIKYLIDAWNPKIEFIYVTLLLKKDNSPLIIEVGQIGDMDLSDHEFKKI